jgi:hypothetical protein
MKRIVEESMDHERDMKLRDKKANSWRGVWSNVYINYIIRHFLHPYNNPFVHKREAIDW